jgi:hypothetical protein
VEKSKKKKKDLKSIALCTTGDDSKETIQIHETVTWVGLKINIYGTIRHHYRLLAAS